MKTRCAMRSRKRRWAKRSGLVDGQLVVPQGPGLGIEIDRDVLERHRVA